MAATNHAIRFRPEHQRRITIVVVVAAFALFWWLKYGFELPRFATRRIYAQGDLSSKEKSLTMANETFYLDGKPVQFFSGAVHYFRVVPEYWDDRLQKLKAAGLNTVETYVPWNWHEEIKGQYDFTGILDIRKFIEKADSLGLYVIVRPGPYICSEWEFGGLPSWLLHDPDMVIRSRYKPCLDAWDTFFGKFMPEIHDLQKVYGGPIVAMQVENEYGSYHGTDTEYLPALIRIMQKHGVKELLFTSDSIWGLPSHPPVNVLTTVNLKLLEHAKTNFQFVRERQPGWPLFVMEFWTGWFDFWGGNHQAEKPEGFEETLSYILESKASFNLYMFHGGTNFGFMNGANVMDDYIPIVTSYDYDSPLNEYGQTTEKYVVLRKMLSNYYHEDLLPPLDVITGSYSSFAVQSVMSFRDLLSYVTPIDSPDIVTMEMLDINSHGGQGYGFIVYENMVPAESKTLRISGHVRDRAQVLLDGQEVAVLDWKKPHNDVNIQLSKEAKLHIMVENIGRVNAGMKELNDQRKGLTGPVYLDKNKMAGWKIYPLEFKKNYLERVLNSDKWRPRGDSDHGPALYKGIFTISVQQPRDTFLSLEVFKKGVVFINNFNLGRYWDIGPTKTLYVPAPLLQTGENTILIFELHAGSNHRYAFLNKPDLG